MQPVTPGSITSRTEPRSKAITGVAQAMASIMTRPTVLANRWEKELRPPRLGIVPSQRVIVFRRTLWSGGRRIGCLLPEASERTGPQPQDKDYEPKHGSAK